MANAQTLNAMNSDQTLIMVREKHLFIFWVTLTIGVSVFAVVPGPMMADPVCEKPSMVTVLLMFGNAAVADNVGGVAALNSIKNGPAVAAFTLLMTSDKELTPVMLPLETRYGVYSYAPASGPTMLRLLGMERGARRQSVLRLVGTAALMALDPVFKG